EPHFRHSIFIYQFHDAIFQIGNLIRLEDHMQMLASSAPPSPTATVSCCPQCGATMRIKLIEPDLKDAFKARHVFECEECNLPRAYFIERPPKKSGWLVWRFNGLSRLFQ